MAYAPTKTSGGMVPAATQQVRKPVSPMAQPRGIPARPAAPKPMITPQAPTPQFGTPVTGSGVRQRTFQPLTAGQPAQVATQPVAQQPPPVAPAIAPQTPVQQYAEPWQHPGGAAAWIRERNAGQQYTPTTHPGGVAGRIRDRNAQTPFDPNSEIYGLRRTDPSQHPGGIQGWIQERNAARTAAQQPYSMGTGGFNNQAQVTMDPMLKIRMLMRQRQMQGQQPQATY